VVVHVDRAFCFSVVFCSYSRMVKKHKRGVGARVKKIVEIVVDMALVM